MSAHVIDPDYRWKEAASREGVDYEAVQKSFMDQAYGVVANKAKILFKDPFRLGFEIVHRNEKATRMVGIFAFRVNGEIIYAPVFFVNGEIKPADMLYLSDTKLFKPLTEDWCSFLVRGAKQEGGQTVDRNRTRQADAYMDRLAYPQRVKYASADTPFDFDSMVRHCAEEVPFTPTLPRLIDATGPDTLEKLAALIEGSETAQRYLSQNYTEEQLTTVTTWLGKEASVEETLGISIVMSPDLCKSASSRARIMTRGYDLIDSRPESALNHVVEEINEGFVCSLNSACCADVLTGSGDTCRAILFKLDQSLGDSDVNIPSYEANTGKPSMIYYPESKELGKLRGAEVFGSEPACTADEALTTCGAKDLSVGKGYIIVDIKTMQCSDVFKVLDKSEDGDCVRIKCCDGWGGSQSDLIYAPGRERTSGQYVSDNHCFLEVAIKEDQRDGDGFDVECDKILMDAGGIDKWMRTAGGTTESSDVRVRKNDRDLFDVTHTNSGGVVKQSRDLGMLEAHLTLAEDFAITTDKAGELLDKSSDSDVSYRVYDSLSKSGYVTRQEGMQDWISSYDPELQVKMDAPQQQQLSTFTPKRNEQQSRYGDTFQRVPAENREEYEDGLPKDALLSRSPEELVQMSQQYQMPHIFDHGCLEQMSTTSFSVADQIRQYIPDLEQGVDRLYRILFLLRYRPADFEESYGKDAILEMEQDLSDNALSSGENLLRLLQRFDEDQYTTR